MIEITIVAEAETLPVLNKETLREGLASLPEEIKTLFDRLSGLSANDTLVDFITASNSANPALLKA